MSISKAIAKKDKDLLKETVEKAVKVYNYTVSKEEPIIETAYGPMEVSMAAAIDKKTFWFIATQTYTEISKEVRFIHSNADKDVEIAKLIASNPTLRALVDDSKQNSNGLL